MRATWVSCCERGARRRCWRACRRGSSTTSPPPTSRPWSSTPARSSASGLNYEDHILEMGRELPATRRLFAKYTEALIGAHDQIVLPRVSDAVDWEVELALGDRAVGAPRHRRRGRRGDRRASPSPTTSRCATTRAAPSSSSRARRSSTPPPSARGSSHPTKSVACNPISRCAARSTAWSVSTVAPGSSCSTRSTSCAT